MQIRHREWDLGEPKLAPIVHQSRPIAKGEDGIGQEVISRPSLEMRQAPASASVRPTPGMLGPTPTPVPCGGRGVTPGPPTATDRAESTSHQLVMGSRVDSDGDVIAFLNEIDVPAFA